MQELFPSVIVGLIDQYYGLPDGVIVQWLDFDGAWGGYGLIYATDKTSVQRENLPTGHHPWQERVYTNVWTVGNNVLSCHRKFRFLEEDYQSIDQALATVEKAWESMESASVSMNQYRPDAEIRMQFSGDVLKGIWLHDGVSDRGNLHLPKGSAYRWWDSDSLCMLENKKKADKTALKRKRK